MDNKAWAQGVAKKIQEKEIEVIKRSVNKVPYIAKTGVFDDLSETRLGWWTNGFWGGMMWQLYQATKEPIYKEVAENLEKKMDSVLMDSSVMSHDSGFRWLPTAVANYRLSGPETEVCLQPPTWQAVTMQRVNLLLHGIPDQIIRLTVGQSLTV